MANTSIRDLYRMAESSELKQRKKAFRPLVNNLKHENWTYRRDSAEALGKLGDKRAVKPLIRCLYDANEKVRVEVVAALGNLGDISAVDPLISFQKKDDSYESMVAVKSLGKIGDTRAVDPLLKLLNQESLNRSTAIEALGRIGDSRAVEPLITCLKDKKNQLREKAMAALGELGDARAIEPLISVVEMHEYGYYEYNNYWIEAMEKLFDKLPYSTLIEYLENSKVCKYAVMALGELDDNPAVESVIKCLESKDTREVSARVLGEVGDKRAVEPLIKCLEYEVNYANRIAEALGKLGDKRAVEPLIKCLECEVNRANRIAEIEALEKLGDKRAVEPLMWCLDEYGNTAAAKALGQLGDARAVDSLVRCLVDENRDMRDVAVKALELLGEPQWKVYMRKDGLDFETILKSEPRSKIETLIQSLHYRLVSKSDKVRVDTADVLACLGEPQWQEIIVGDVIEALDRLLQVKPVLLEAIVITLKMIINDTYEKREKRKQAALTLVSVAEKHPRVDILTDQIKYAIRYHTDDHYDYTSDSCGVEHKDTHTDKGLGFVSCKTDF